MMKKPIEVVQLEKAQNGYKVLASWRRPNPEIFAKKVDLWFPEIAPSISLVRKYRGGKIDWDDLATLYACELHSPSMQEYLKPLALLSLRRKLVLLCDCPKGLRCPNLILLSELKNCRDKRDFILQIKNPAPSFDAY